MAERDPGGDRAVTLGSDSLYRPEVVVRNPDGTPISGGGTVSGALINRSGAIAVGATSQQLAAALPARKFLFIQNLSLDDLWINFGAAAVQDQPSIRLVPDAAFQMDSAFVSTEAVHIIGPNAGAKFVAKEA